MLGTFTILLLCQLVGELIARLGHLPVPGPVLGMLLLFICLCIRGRVPDSMRETSGGLLRNLSLLFVPAGVGVMLHLPRLADEALPITASLVISTLLGIVVTGLIMSRLTRPRGPAAAPSQPSPDMGRQ